MRPRLRSALVIDAAFAAAMVAVISWWGLRADYLRDFVWEAQPAVKRLLAGDLHGFLASSPVYSGSMVLRAPVMALAPDPSTAYRLGAIECVVVVACLGLALVHRGDLRRPRAFRWLVVATLVVNPISALALQYGHPEDLLASALAVAGLLCALRNSTIVTGILLGLAVASKQWAVIAVPITLAVTPGGRMRLAAAATTTAGLVLAPVAAVAGASFVAANRAAATVAGGFANPDNVWWLIGAYHTLPGKEHSILFTPAPSDLAAHASRPLILLLPVALALAFVWRRRLVVMDDALLLLAAAGLLRCMLDPWNVVYYHLPFLVALLVWEVRRRPGLPLLSIGATGLVWLTFQTLPGLASRNVATIFYMAWAAFAVAAMSGHSLRLRMNREPRRSRLPSRSWPATGANRRRAAPS